MEFREKLMAFMADESPPLTEDEKSQMAESHQPAILCTFLNLVHAQGHQDEAAGEREESEEEQADAAECEVRLASGTKADHQGPDLRIDTDYNHTEYIPSELLGGPQCPPR